MFKLSCPGCALVLVCGLAFCSVSAQTVTGSAKLEFDPRTKDVIATCETQLDAALQKYYGAQVECVVADGHDHVIATGHQDDNDGVQGYAKVVLSYPSRRGDIYYATAKHRVAYRRKDLATTKNPTFVDVYNLQSVSEKWQPAYNLMPSPNHFQGPGPETHSGAATLTLFRTSAWIDRPVGIDERAGEFLAGQAAILVGEPGGGNYGCSSGEELIAKSDDVVLTSHEAQIDCGGLKCAGLKRSGTTDEISHYIQGAEANNVPERCVASAYRTIAQLAQGERIPVLISLLSARRPPTNNQIYCEKHPCVMVHTWTTPIDEYPAAVALRDLGNKATTAVFDFMVKGAPADGVGWHNAVYVYFLAKKQTEPFTKTLSDLKAYRDDFTDPGAVSRINEAIKVILAEGCGEFWTMSCQDAVVP